MGLLSLMKKKQRRTPFQSCLDAQFFFDNNGVLTNIPQFSRFAKASDPFDIIRANILIRALKNKDLIETAYKEFARDERRDLREEDELPEYMKAKKLDLPYFVFNGQKIFVPFFNATINRYYANQTEKLSSEPFSVLNTSFEVAVIDPFDYYGTSLYDSPFSRLVRVTEKNGIVAFFSYDSLSIYIVNKSGRLDAEICLFDKGLSHPSTTHMLERVVGPAKAFLDGDYKEFAEELVKNKLISSNLIMRNNYDSN